MAIGNQIVIRSSPVVALNRRQPLLAGNLTPATTPPTTPTIPRKRTSSNVGEVAGGTAAGCVVVCCCCPCVLVEFLILTVYKVPSTIIRRIWRKQRQKVKTIKKKKGVGGLLHMARSTAEGSGASESHHKVVYGDEVSDVDLREFEKVKVSIDGSAIELDKQMWDQFQNTGFWRSPSQRHTC